MTRRSTFTLVLLVLLLVPAVAVVAADRSDTCQSAQLLTPQPSFEGTLTERDPDNFRLFLDRNQSLWIRVEFERQPEGLRLETHTDGVSLVPGRHLTLQSEDVAKLDPGRQVATARLDWTSGGPQCFVFIDGGGPNTLYPYDYVVYTSTNGPFELEDTATTTEPETTAPPETTTDPETTVPPETTTDPETTAPPETTTVPKTTVPPETTTEPETTVPPETTTEPETTGPVDISPGETPNGTQNSSSGGLTISPGVLLFLGAVGGGLILIHRM